MGGTLHGHSEIRKESGFRNESGFRKEQDGMNKQPENFDRLKLPLGESDV